jgi:hypothetical protein
MFYNCLLRWFHTVFVIPSIKDAGLIRCTLILLHLTEYKNGLVGYMSGVAALLWQHKV